MCTARLKGGLQSLSDAFPWITENVVTQSGLYKTEPGARTMPKIEVQDLRATFPSFHDLKEAGYPFSMLDGAIVAPSCGNSNIPSLESPVFAARVTFVAGGSLLVMSGHRSYLDIAGLSQLAYLFSKACCNDPFTTEQKRVGNLSRRNFLPFLPYATLTTRPSETLRGTWSYFLVSKADLESLKSVASSTLPPGSENESVPSDDVLTAFVWQSIIRSRLTRLDKSSTSTLQHEINARPQLGLPATYMGNAVYNLANTCDIQSLVTSPLGIVAAKLRSSMTVKDLGLQVRELATDYALARDLIFDGDSDATSMLDRKPYQAVECNPLNDLKARSWAQEKCSEFSFGWNRAVSAVRMPSFGAEEGLVYLMPKDFNGGIAVALCLREEDLVALKADEEFTKSGRWVE